MVKFGQNKTEKTGKSRNDSLSEWLYNIRLKTKQWHEKHAWVEPLSLFLIAPLLSVYFTFIATSSNNRVGFIGVGVFIVVLFVYYVTISTYVTKNLTIKQWWERKTEKVKLDELIEEGDDFLSFEDSIKVTRSVDESMILGTPIAVTIREKTEKITRSIDGTTTKVEVIKEKSSITSNA